MALCTSCCGSGCLASLSRKHQSCSCNDALCLHPCLSIVHAPALPWGQRDTKPRASIRAVTSGQDSDPQGTTRFDDHVQEPSPSFTLHHHLLDPLFTVPSSTGAPNHDMCSLPAAPKQTGLSPPRTPRLSRHCQEVWLWPLSPLHCGPCFSLSTICSSHSVGGVIHESTPKETSISGTVSRETQPQTVPILL